MSDEIKPIGRISTRYLLLMISFTAGALVTTKGFAFVIASGFTTVAIVRAGICLFLFSACCISINKRNYFYDLTQRKYLTNLQLSFVQVVLALGTLLFWVFLKLVLFGSK